MSPLIQYTSFLIRMWRPCHQEPDGRPGEWRSEVEHLQSKASWSFTTLDELLAFLQNHTEHPQWLAQTEVDL